MRTNGDCGTQAIAEDIARYLKRHPQAADSAEGIRRWWLGSGRVESLEATECALDYLEKRGLVLKKRLGDQIIYCYTGREKP